MGIMVKVLAISLHSGNSSFVPSGWFMHAWSHMCDHEEGHETSAHCSI